MKLSLYEGNPIYNGTNKCSRSKTKRHPKKVFVFDEDGNGHAYEIVGYDDNYEDGEGNKGAFRAKNSNKDFPEFRIMYYQVDLGYLYSTIALILDPTRVAKKKIEENQKLIELAVEKKITNGNDLDIYATRNQVAVIIGRALYGPNLDYDTYLGKTVTEGIRNGSRDNEFIQRYELIIMVARFLLPFSVRAFAKDHQLIEAMVTLGITNGNNQDQRATRKQAILMVTRAILKKENM